MAQTRKKTASKKPTKKVVRQRTRISINATTISKALVVAKFWLYKNFFRLMEWLKRKKSTGVQFVKDIPIWFKQRPAKIKLWLKEGRKKKKYRSFRLQKRLKPEPRFVPTAGALIKDSLRFLWQHKRVFIAIIAIHAVIYFMFLKIPSQSGGIQTIRDTVKSVLGEGSETSIKGNLATLGAVLTTSGSGQSSGTATAVSLLLMSLVYIWAIRQLSNKQKIKARDAYYQGMAPILSTAMLLLVLSLQLIPFAVASFVYSTARAGGLFATGLEDLSFFLIALLLGLFSFYLMTSTIIGLYIVTLPGMYPMRALRAAKKLVQFQRLKVFRRIIALPLLLGAVYIAGLLLLIRFLPNQTLLATEIIPLLLLPFIHIYLYKLYRSLI